MRKTSRVFAAVGPAERLGTAIRAMPPAVVDVLAAVAARTDLPLASGTWGDDAAGCLVANAVACAAGVEQGRRDGEVRADGERTLDLRMLDAFPQMSSRDLNTLIVAWDEATVQAAATDDRQMRGLLRRALAWTGVPVVDATTPAPPDDDAGVVSGDVLATY